MNTLITKYNLKEIALPNDTTTFFIESEILDGIFSNENIKLYGNISEKLLIDIYKAKTTSEIILRFQSSDGYCGFLYKSFNLFKESLKDTRIHFTQYVKPSSFVLFIRKDNLNAYIKTMKVKKIYQDKFLNHIIYVLKDGRLLAREGDKSAVLCTSIEVYEQFKDDISETEKLIDLYL